MTFKTVDYAAIMKSFSSTVEKLVTYAKQQEATAKDCELSIIALEDKRRASQEEAVKANSSAQKIKDMFDL